VTRGDLVTVALQGEIGKPRPALIVQADDFRDSPSVVIIPITSDIGIEDSVRCLIAPEPQNGLRQLSAAMVDKITYRQRDKVGPVFGRLSDDQMADIDARLSAILGLA
jgi:mRNA interferase MazF